MNRAVGFLCSMVYVLWVFSAGCGDAERARQLQAIDERMTRLEKKLDQLDIIEQSITELENTTQSQQQTIASLAEFDTTLEKRLEALRRPSAVKASSAKSMPASGAYTVQRGDTLYLIAKKHGLSVDELCRLNKTKPGQVIKPGQQLLVVPAR